MCWFISLAEKLASEKQLSQNDMDVHRLNMKSIRLYAKNNELMQYSIVNVVVNLIPVCFTYNSSALV